MELLTKKEKNRISCSLNQSQLGLFDTQDKKISKEITENVINSMEKCTPNIKSTLDVFLCGATTNEYYRKFFSTIDSDGIANISKVCSQLENNKNILNKVSIRTVFGGTNAMPFRALSYLLPALNMCEELKKINKDADIPNIEFLFMNGAGIMANALDPYKAEQTTAQFINVAKKYIEEYHPLVKDNVNFYVDRTFSQSIMKTQEYEQIHKILEKKLGIEEQLKSELLDMGKRRNAAQNSIKYGALHAFSQDGVVNHKIAKMSNFFGGEEQKDCEIIISIGAKPEEKFFKVRKLVAEEVSKIEYFKTKQTVQYIANINVPPYSPLGDGELYLQDALKNPSLILKARKVDRKNGEFGEYQVPVQKAIEMIIKDVDYSQSNKDIFDFIQEFSKTNQNQIIK